MTSVLKWLSHKTAKRVTKTAGFCYKSCQTFSAEIYLKWWNSAEVAYCYFWGDWNQLRKLQHVSIFGLASTLDKCKKYSSWPPHLSPYNFFRRQFEQRKCILPPFSTTQLQFITISFKWSHVFIHRGVTNGAGKGSQLPGCLITIGVPNDCGERRVPRQSEDLSSIH